MQAVIMAGGKGTRLASVTQNIPKPMVPFAGQPLLQYQVENLRKCGYTSIIMVVGYLGDVIRDYFGDGERFGVKITYYTEQVPLGTAGALPELLDRLEPVFTLVFGDLYFNIDFGRMMAFHQRSNAEITLFAHPNSHPYDSDIVIADSDGLVVDWSKKNSERQQDYQNLVNAGIYIISKNALTALAVGQKADLEKQLILPKIPDKVVYSYHSSEYVKDIGTPERLEHTQSDYLNGICEKRNLSYKQKCIFLDRDGTLNKYVGFLTQPDQVELEDTVAEAVRKINVSEYLAIVITNQPVLARGDCDAQTLERIHNRLYTLLGKSGAYLDGLYYCPHHPDKGFAGEVPELKLVCQCRKPNTGMLIKAAQDFNIDLNSSWFIGDTDVDVMTAVNGGVHSCLLSTGDPKKKTKYDVESDLKANSLLEAVDNILCK